MKTLKKPKNVARKPKSVRTPPPLDLPSPKVAALELIGRLADDVTWDRLMYHLEVRQGIERGLAQAKAGQLHDMDDVFDELLRDLDE